MERILSEVLWPYQEINALLFCTGRLMDVRSQKSKYQHQTAFHHDVLLNNIRGCMHLSATSDYDPDEKCMHPLNRTAEG